MALFAIFVVMGKQLLDWIGHCTSNQLLFFEVRMFVYPPTRADTTVPIISRRIGRHFHISPFIYHFDNSYPGEMSPGETNKCDVEGGWGREG